MKTIYDINNFIILFLNIILNLRTFNNENPLLKPYIFKSIVTLIVIIYVYSFSAYLRNLNSRIFKDSASNASFINIFS